MARPYHILDVFTDHPLQGNPLAVVLEAEGLDDAAMQAIAREFNLAETVFVFPPVDPANSARIRIFTPARELPFAGHPTVGTAVLLAELLAGGQIGGAGIVIALEEKIGLVKVEVARRPKSGVRGVFALPVLPQMQEADFNVEAVAHALGLDPLEIGFGAHGISLWSAGVPFVMVPIRDLAAIGRVQIGDNKAWDAAFAHAGTGAAYLYTRETVDPACHIHARMFAPKMGITEDPATGSAAAAFAGVAATCELPEDGLHQIIIEQGFEMGRPSLIALDLDIQKGRLAGAQIGGAAVRIAEGTLFL
jgi:trans-2,3-dihydro-3-hydroxyanthranilate isomerase